MTDREIYQKYLGIVLLCLFVFTPCVYGKNLKKVAQNLVEEMALVKFFVSSLRDHLSEPIGKKVPQNMGYLWYFQLALRHLPSSNSLAITPYLKHYVTIPSFLNSQEKNSLGTKSSQVLSSSRNFSVKRLS